MTFIRPCQLYKAYRFKLNPNKAQKEFLDSNMGASRFTYNWALDQIKTIRKSSEEEIALAYKHLLVDDGFTKKKLLNNYFLRKLWNSVKDQETAECSDRLESAVVTVVRR